MPAQRSWRPVSGGPGARNIQPVGHSGQIEAFVKVLAV